MPEQLDLKITTTEATFLGNSGVEFSTPSGVSTEDSIKYGILKSPEAAALARSLDTEGMPGGLHAFVAQAQESVSRFIGMGHWREAADIARLVCRRTDGTHMQQEASFLGSVVLHKWCETGVKNLLDPTGLDYFGLLAKKPEGTLPDVFMIDAFYYTFDNTELPQEEAAEKRNIIRRVMLETALRKPSAAHHVVHHEARMSFDDVLTKPGASIFTIMELDEKEQATIKELFEERFNELVAEDELHQANTLLKIMLMGEMVKSEDIKRYVLYMAGRVSGQRMNRASAAFNLNLGDDLYHWNVEELGNDWEQLCPGISKQVVEAVWRKAAEVLPAQLNSLEGFDYRVAETLKRYFRACRVLNLVPTEETIERWQELNLELATEIGLNAKKIEMAASTIHMLMSEQLTEEESYLLLTQVLETMITAATKDGGSGFDRSPFVFTEQVAIALDHYTEKDGVERSLDDYFDTRLVIDWAERYIAMPDDWQVSPEIAAHVMNPLWQEHLEVMYPLEWGEDNTDAYAARGRFEAKATDVAHYISIKSFLDTLRYEPTKMYDWFVRFKSNQIKHYFTLDERYDWM
jgi:hypothetical protein